MHDVCLFSSFAFSRHVRVVSEWKPHHQSCLHSKIVTMTQVHAIFEIPISCEFGNYQITSHHITSYHIISYHINHINPFFGPFDFFESEFLGFEALSIHFSTFFVLKTGVFFYLPFPPKSRHSQGQLASSMWRSSSRSITSPLQNRWKKPRKSDLKGHSITHSGLGDQTWCTFVW